MAGHKKRFLYGGVSLLKLYNFSYINNTTLNEGICVMGGNITRKLTIVTGIWVLALLFIPTFMPKTFAQITLYTGSQPTELVRVDLGDDRATPTVKYNGNTLGTSANYVWTSSDTTVASLTTSNRRVEGMGIGEATLTVTFNGESAQVPVKVTQRTLFTEAPVRDGVPPILGLLGATLGAHGGQLVSYPDTTPLVDAPVTFYEEIGGNEICSATTDENGNASCMTVLVGYSDQVYVSYEGDDQYSPAGRQAVE
jgi:hypothetical protein